MECEQLCMGCMENRNIDEAKCQKCGFVEGSMPDSPLFLPPRTVLEGKYLIGRVLGQGGFGITYLAWDLNLNVKLAIKEYFPQDLASRAAGHSQVSAYSGTMGSQYDYGLDKFLQEARTLAQFEGHPNIVSVRDFFKANGTAYFVMSYVEGITLKEHLANAGGKLPIDQARGIIMPVLDALREVHSVNILHRDISPDNIFINQKGQVILIDFGAARQAIGEKGRSLSIILKPGYAPEEQYRSKGIQGPWTDIYAVAATLYHLLTGTLPPESLERLVEDSFVPPTELGASLSKEEENAILKALAVRSSERYQSVPEFQAALTGKQKVEGLTPPTAYMASDTLQQKPSFEKKKFPLTMAIAAAALLVVGVAAFALWSMGIIGGDTTAISEEPEEHIDELVEETFIDEPEEVEAIAVVNQIGNSTGNIVNGGLASYQGDWVYFRSNEGGSLYRGNLNNGEARIINADAAWFINVIGEWIYYSNRDDNDRIYKIKTDGSERTALTDGSSWFVTVIEDWIYYINEQDEYRIYKIGIDGSNRIKISDDSAWFLNIDNEWIYFVNRSDGDKIYRVRVDASETEVISDYAACCINYYNGWIYHTNEEDGSKLYRVKPDGSEKEELTEHPVWFINVSEDWVYYVNEEDAFSLNKIRTDGTGRVKLTNEPARYTVLIDGWVIYLNHAEEDLTYKVRTDGTGLSLIESGF